MVSKTSKKPPKKNDRPKGQGGKTPRKKHWVTDTDGTLGVAKSIASRFGIELVEEEFFLK